MRPSLWKVIAGFILTLVIAEFAIRALEPSLPSPTLWPTREAALKSEQLERLGKDVSLVFLGSSSTEAAIDPEMLEDLIGHGVPYNAALPFSTPLSDQVWVRDVVLEESIPDLAVIGISPWPVHTTVDADPLRTGLQKALEVRGRSDPWFIPTLIEHKGLLGDWDERATNDQLLASGLWTDLGHQTGYYDRSFESISGAFPPFGKPEMSSDNADALRDVVRMLRHEGADIVFMIEPARYPGEVPDATVEKYLASVDALADDLEVPVWDLHHVEWDATYFADEAHPNRAGTEAVTNYVADLLRGADWG